MKKILLCLAFVCFFALLLTGCGGSSSSGTPQTASGVFIDAPVEGLSYVSGSHSGVTGTGGTFTYEVGQPITFSLGGVTLGSATGQPVITPVHIALSSNSSANASTIKAYRITQFLMSITNSTLNSTSMTITPAMRTAAQNLSINFDTVSDAALLSAVQTISSGVTQLVTSGTAIQHLSNSIYSNFAGTYSGTYSGTNSGTWSISISSSGIVSGSLGDGSSVTGSLVNGTVFSGNASGSGWIGNLNIMTGVFSGTWSGSGISGTFTGTKH